MNKVVESFSVQYSASVLICFVSNELPYGIVFIHCLLNSIDICFVLYIIRIDDFRRILYVCFKIDYLLTYIKNCKYDMATESYRYLHLIVSSMKSFNESRDASLEIKGYVH